MRTSWALLALGLVGCAAAREAADAGLDAQVTDAGLEPVDAFVPPDADRTCPVLLLEGGTDLELQGWSTVTQEPATLTYGATLFQLETTTASGASTGGQLLLVRPGVERPFRLEVVMQVEAPGSTSGAAILGSFTAPSGTDEERAQTIFVGERTVAWGDDSGSTPLVSTGDHDHTYLLAVDEHGNAALSVDGTEVLTRTGYTTNGTIAIGDPSSEPDVDATLRIRSVRLLCP